MTLSLRALALITLSFGLAACAGETTDPADAPLAGETDIVEAATEIPAGTYALDPVHSEIGFVVRHFGISNVDGTFNDFEGMVTVPESGLDGMSATLTAQVASIDTDNADRDGHLKAPDFFAAEEYPTLTFQTTSITPTGGNTFTMTGDLTMRGVTRPITLEGEYLGSSQGMGTPKIGFQAEGEIDRQEWGISWNNTNEAGEIAVSDDVTLRIGVEADLQGDDGMEGTDA